RSMSTKEGDHTRATYFLRTGYLPQGPVHYPTVGSLLSKELGSEDAALPNFVSIAPATFLSPAAYGPGFLGPRYAPLVVGGSGYGFGPGRNYEQALKVQDSQPPAEVSAKQADARLHLVRGLQEDFMGRHPGLS